MQFLLQGHFNITWDNVNVRVELTEAFVFWNNAEQSKLSELNDKAKTSSRLFFLPFFMEDTKNMLKFLGLLWSSTSKLYCISIQLWLCLVKIFEGSLRILRLLAGNERSSKILSRILRILREFLKIFQGSLKFLAWSLKILPRSLGWKILEDLDKNFENPQMIFENYLRIFQILAKIFKDLSP